MSLHSWHLCRVKISPRSLMLTIGYPSGFGATPGSIGMCRPQSEQIAKAEPEELRMKPPEAEEIMPVFYHKIR